MGLFGPPRSARAQQQQQQQTQKIRTGGAGNMQWYRPEVTQAAMTLSGRQSARNGSASQRPLSAQQSARPASASARQSPASSSRAQYEASPTLPVPSPTSPLRPSSARSERSGAEEAHDEECICTVCSCGRHACPPTPRTNHYEPGLMSEARASYSGRFVPAQRVRPNDNWKPRNVPFEGATTHQVDFAHPGPVQTRRALNRSALMDTGVLNSSAPFDDTTTHKSDFPAHPIRPRSARAPLDGGLDFGDDQREFDTENRANFVPHPLQPRRSGPVETLRPSLPFHGASTAATDYCAFPGARPAVPKFRTGEWEAAPDDRDFNSEFRASFTPKSVAPCPAIPVATSSKPVSGHVKVQRDPLTNTFRRTQGW